ncbi:hypothetical protein, partial [Klebsiella pneumoniae]
TKSYSNRAQIGISKKVIPLWRPQTAGPPEHFVVFGRKIPRTPMTGGKSMLAWIDCVLHFSQTDKLYLSTFAAEVSMLNFNKASTTSS